MYLSDNWVKAFPYKHAPDSLMVSNGRIPDVSGVVKFGYNSDLDTGASETVWTQGGMWQPSSGAEIIDIVSTSANDTELGTGAWYVYIFGLDADYNQVEEQVTLNGLGTVSTTTAMREINRVAVAYSGSSNYNEGVITFTQTTSGLQLAQINTNNSITEQCVYTVPAGYSAYLTGIFVNSTKASGGGGNPEVNFHLLSYNDSSKTEYNVLDVVLDTQKAVSLTIDQPFANLTAEKNTLHLSAETDTNNTRVFGRFYMYLIKNT